MFAIPNDVGEMGDPVTQDNHTRFLRQLKIDFDVAMAIDEKVDIFMGFEVFFR